MLFKTFDPFSISIITGVLPSYAQMFPSEEVNVKGHKI